MNINIENVVELVIANAARSRSCIDKNFVFIKTSCTLIFSLPLLPVPYRDPAQSPCDRAGSCPEQNDGVFCAAPWICEEPSIRFRLFVCDRHFWKRKAIVEVFGDSVSIFCVHITRNIRSNCGTDTDIVSRFWGMRYQRTQAGEDASSQALRRLHFSRQTFFTAEPLNSLASFVPSALDPDI